ncbi:MAG: hypothetical protein HF978_13700 [Desulfobacteraceae bacterium]|nr:hypothetical protein [Desulfobacteraceae bacterium]MBC2756597.1 hypothetical protein [Desulfobacteraceae bacterium]
MKYRLNKQALLDVLKQWNGFLKRKIHLIACGGTALTLLDVKPSTKDVDFMVPNDQEYKYLIKILKDLGYRQTTGSGWQRKGEMFIFDLFQGKRIHTTELLESPLKEGNHILLKEYSHLYIGILNDYDLIASKLFRGSSVDFEDCLMLVNAYKGKIDINHFVHPFKELAKYDVSEKRIVGNLEHFISLIQKERLGGK